MLKFILEIMFPMGQGVIPRKKAPLLMPAESVALDVGTTCEDI